MSKYLMIGIVVSIIMIIVLYMLLKEKYPNLLLKSFDSPGAPESHEKMNEQFMSILNDVFGEFYRQTKKTLVVNSGFRTPEANANAEGAKKSAHMIGGAADISTRNLTLDEKKLLAKLLYKHGIRRFGMGNTFIHADIGDKLDKKIYSSNAVWNYGNTPEFNPLSLT